MSMVLPAARAADRIAFGLTIFFPDTVFFLTHSKFFRVRVLSPDKPDAMIIDNRAQHLIVAPSLGFRAFDRLHLGAGLQFISSTNPDLRVNLDSNNVLEVFAGEAVQTGSIRVDLPTKMATRAGALYDGGFFSIGAAYRQKKALNGRTLTQLILTNANIDLATLTLDSPFVNWYVPQQVALGGFLKLLPHLDLKLFGEVTWRDWSKMPATNYDSITLGGTLGGLFCPVEDPSCLSSVAIDPNFRDTLTPAVALAYTAPLNGGATPDEMPRKELELTTRVGYQFQPTPVPDQIGESNFVDNDRHMVSLGVGLSINRSFDIDTFVQYYRLVPRTTIKEAPFTTCTIADPCRTSGTIVNAGLSSTMKF